MKDFKRHYVAVIGGSISGSEAANLLAKNGFRVVVFDMNALPYGKIEDGLPNWHINLRNRQEKEIDKKLDHENIRFVPLVKIGRDIKFDDLVNNWGFSAVILANGAWNDRKFPLDGIEKFKDNGLIYQNDFIYWFNHKHEADFNGKNYQIKDNMLVVGGGLASLDVVKIIMIELVSSKLNILLNVRENPFEIEKYGIKKILLKYDLSIEDLNIEPPTLIYRRHAAEMPLKSPKDESAASMEKAKKVSEKLLNNYVNKYNFNFKPLSVPIGFIEENGKFKGLKLQKVMSYNGRIVPIENEIEIIKSDLLISSIGSLPEPLDGLQYENAALKMKKYADYHVYGFDNVFAVGNAVTGRGNIQESKQHGQQITRKIIDQHLTEGALEEWLINLNNAIKSDVTEKMNSIVQEIGARDIQPDDIIKSILSKTAKINQENGYKTYSEWIKRHRPVRLEALLKKEDSQK